MTLEASVRDCVTLAELAVSPEEIAGLVQHCAKMVEFVGRLEEASAPIADGDAVGVDAGDAWLALQRSCAADDLRRDVPRQTTVGEEASFDRDRVAENAPDWDPPFFVTPPVL